MASARPAFAVDDTRQLPFGAPPGVRENTTWWHIAPVLLIAPPAGDIAAAHRGDMWGSACYTVACIYVRLDLRTNQLWFLEYKSVVSQQHGTTKTLRWFDEDGARARWWSSWHTLLQNAGLVTTIQPMYFARPDSSFDYGPMKVQYRGLAFHQNTPDVGGPPIAHFHDGRPPTPG